MKSNKTKKTLQISRKLHEKLRAKCVGTGLKFYEFIERILKEAVK